MTNCVVVFFKYFIPSLSGRGKILTNLGDWRRFLQKTRRKRHSSTDGEWHVTCWGPPRGLVSVSRSAGSSRTFSWISLLVCLLHVFCLFCIFLCVFFRSLELYVTPYSWTGISLWKHKLFNYSSFWSIRQNCNCREIK